ncbi:MAG: DedA family protein [Nitrososphaerota archaeon]|nr:DedA family protein [Nitrososphaerota archaeon]
MQKGSGDFRSMVPRNKYLLAASFVVLVVGVLEATDLIDLPFGSWFQLLSGSIFSSATLNAFMSKYGYASVFGLMLLESASLPVPSEVVLPLAGYFIRLGVLKSFWVAVGVSTLGGLAGSLVDYFLAIWLGRPFVAGLLRLFRMHRDVLDRAEAWFGRSAQWTVFAARFVPGLRTVISLPAGLFEMDLATFAAMTLAGSFAWSVVLIYAGFLAGSVSGTGFASSSVVIDGLSGILAAISAGYIGFYVYTAFHRAGGEPTLPASGL